MPAIMQGGWFRQRVLIVVRTYPVPATNGAEVSCTAGITVEGKWIRLFPIPYRFLDPDSQFSKYHWIDVNIRKAPNDARPESYKIDRDSIQIVRFVGPQRGWRARKDLVYPLRAHCQCCLNAAWEAHHQPTLGFFRPKSILRLEIEETSPEWTPDELAKLHQELPPMFGDDARRPKKPLEKIPFIFRYVFTCDEPACHSHTMMCADWEMASLYRNCRREYGDKWEPRFRQKYEATMIQKLDTQFFVGTVHRWSTWIIIGVSIRLERAKRRCSNCLSKRLLG
jgi:hypothetical protein